ncbi:Vacuolar protein sorting-associated protein 37A [Acipenser ruthenus]|uniref:Vacuolar protein sorting-associated protein 37A n=1 Tax=Acipenser ruthenus TaxID=7906 RepID=A0A444UIX2_ACIRT|nr:Vacuolar protein sorting-associated protein 37A [Acipenser ruthenus]
MNWIFPLSKGSGPLRPLTSLQEQRQRQIESLKTAHSNLAEIQKDVEYRIPFTVNNTTISINILLPPQFPQEKPSVSVYPHIRHHLVDSHNGTMVTSPLITNFTMHSDLGKIIQSIMDEFWNNPPVLAGSSGFAFMYNKPSGIPPYPPQGFHFPAFPQQEAPRPVAPAPMQVPGTDSVPASPLGFNITRPAAPAYGLITDLPLPVPTADSQAGLNGYTYRMPEIPETFQELSELSTSQLKDMSDQEDLLLEHFVCLPQLKQVTSDKDELVKNIVEMAKNNLQLEPQLEGKRQEVLYKSCSLSALQARLKVAAHQAEEESEDIAEDFLEGKIEIDDFLTNFMEKRTVCGILYLRFSDF